MEPLKNLFLLFYVCCFSVSLNAQEADSKNYKKFPLKVSIGNHSVGFPYQNLFQSSNLSLGVGTEWKLNKNIKHQLLLSYNLGFIRNRVIGNTWTSDLDFGYRFLHKSGVFIQTALGIGMLSQFHPRIIYQQNEEDGTYDEVSDTGLFASLITFKTELGYDLSKKSDVPIRISLNHNFFIQTTYFDVVQFPIMPQSTTHLTITYKFQKNEK